MLYTESLLLYLMTHAWLKLEFVTRSVLRKCLRN